MVTSTTDSGSWGDPGTTRFSGTVDTGTHCTGVLSCPHAPGTCVPQLDAVLLSQPTVLTHDPTHFCSLPAALASLHQ